MVENGDFTLPNPPPGFVILKLIVVEDGKFAIFRGALDFANVLLQPDQLDHPGALRIILSFFALRCE
jgi:hypothetical protein